MKTKSTKDFDQTGLTPAWREGSLGYIYRINKFCQRSGVLQDYVFSHKKNLDEVIAEAKSIGFNDIDCLSLARFQRLRFLNMSQ